MSKGRNSRMVGIRVSDELYDVLLKRAEEKGKTLSEYLRDCLSYIQSRSDNTIKVYNPLFIRRGMWCYSGKEGSK